MFQLDQQQNSELKKLTAKYALELLVFFGSSVTSNTHKESDADVAYLSKKPLKLMEEAELAVKLQPILKNRTIDLVNIHMAPPLLLYAISNYGQVLYQSHPLKFYELRAYAFKRYVEAMPLFKLQEERINAIKLDYA